MSPVPTIKLTGTGFDLDVRLGNAPPTPSRGGPLWDEVARPERGAVTEYIGHELVHVEVPVIFDGWRERRDVDPELQAVLALSRAVEGQDPPSFIATGPIPYSGWRFVMEAPEWGDRKGVWGPAGWVLYRQELTLRLVQFVDPDTIELTATASGASAGAKKASAKVTARTKQGDTLLTISTGLYGTPKYAKAIGELNGIRDVRKKLKGGLELRLPPKPVVAGLG